MKKYFLSFCLIACSLLLFTQCKKADLITPTGTVNYSPLSAGSSWTYNFTENASSAKTFTLTVTDKDTVVNGRTYKVLTNSDGSQNNYLAKSDSNYYRFAAFADIGSFEELYLKDNREVNSTWPGTATINYLGSPFPLVADLTYTIKEKGISHSVNGKAYNDVIHIRLDIDIALAGGNVGGGDFYYAKDIGLIENNISLTFLGQSYTSKQELTASTIK